MSAASGIAMPRTRKTLRNFGRNVRFRPASFHRPSNEAEVLELLDQCRDRRIRAVGALHSWSPCAAGDDVVLDLARLDDVRVHRETSGEWRVTVGAGCRIRRLLRELRKRHGLTLPSVGLIDAQSVAGAVATGTHGSGRHSLSHYVTGMRVAAFEASTGEPVIHEWTLGDALRAARCGLGCTGVVLGVTLPCVPVPNVEEYTTRHEGLEGVLALAGDYPLQQAYLIPWLWRWYAHHRRETRQPRSWWALPYRIYRRLGIDYLFHAMVRLMGNIFGSPALIRGFYRCIFPGVMLTGTRCVDRMDRILLMQHQAFRHVETELFVPEESIREAAAFARGFLMYAAGESDNLGEPFDTRLRQHGLGDGLGEVHGSYCHHFPVTFRRVLADDTLISMASGKHDAWWAVSFITYGTRELHGFHRAMDLLARSMAALFGARPHWGKHCPLDHDTLERLYPGLPGFRRFCNELDPSSRFRNAFAADKLGFHAATDKP